VSAPLIRAVSWNLLSYGKSALSTRRGQHELLRFLRPDVVCLQEIYAADNDLAELDRLVCSSLTGSGWLVSRVRRKERPPWGHSSALTAYAGWQTVTC
jgi:hypothetical protein